MTTATTSTPISNASSAAFQTWITEMTTQLTAVGLTQTADTGQINPATVALPGAINTQAGFQIWRFNDALQATSPIFIKFDYGTGASTAVPLMAITIGQGSNGSGTLTGTLGARAGVTLATVSSAITNAPSFWCYNATAGFLGLGYKYGVNNGLVSASVALGGFTLERSCDVTGAATGDAVLLMASVSGTTAGASAGGFSQIYSYLTSAFTTGAVATANSLSAFWPFDVASTTVSGNNQVMPRFLFTPNIQLSNSTGIGLSIEIPVGTTFSAALIGSTSRTYLGMGQLYSNGAVTPQSGQPGLAHYMLWQ